MLWALLLAMLATNAVHANEYPTQAIRVIVPFSAGGNTDVSARILATGLSNAIGKQVVVENRGGAGTTIGTDIVAKAKPDGYTLLFATIAHSVNPNLYAKLPYDSKKDFEPIALVSTNPFVLVTSPAVGVRNLQELLVLLRKNPGQLSYGSAGNGSAMHLAGELFKLVANVDVVHVPYRGESDALTDLVGERIAFGFHGLSTTAGYIKQGNVTPVAVSGATRAKLLPDVPTLKEAGLPDYDAYTWGVMLAPAGTPRPIVEYLNSRINQTMRDPHIVQRFGELGFDPVSDSTPEMTTEHIKREEMKWAPVIKASGMTSSN
jgi:tripartite-type tricarboxylate transporter receptor subunit TctC